MIFVADVIAKPVVTSPTFGNSILSALNFLKIWRASSLLSGLFPFTRGRFMSENAALGIDHPPGIWNTQVKRVLLSMGLVPP